MWRHWRAGHHSWFDHRLDEADWPERIFWVERGALGRFHLPMGARVLDLCCGDGYFAESFWSPGASRVDAVDRDRDALSLARAIHSKGNTAGRATTNMTMSSAGLRHWLHSLAKCLRSQGSSQVTTRHERRCISRSRSRDQRGVSVTKSVLHALPEASRVISPPTCRRHFNSPWREPRTYLGWRDKRKHLLGLDRLVLYSSHSADTAKRSATSPASGSPSPESWGIHVPWVTK